MSFFLFSFGFGFGVDFKAGFGGDDFCGVKVTSILPSSGSVLGKAGALPSRTSRDGSGMASIVTGSSSEASMSSEVAALGALMIGLMFSYILLSSLLSNFKGIDSINQHHNDSLIVYCLSNRPTMSVFSQT
eukprot:m.331730 g.331730  ORF g.331730 m.331730 type:complete len:131 (-) comp16789_c0_seq1:154-546(-)